MNNMRKRIYLKSFTNCITNNCLLSHIYNYLRGTLPVSTLCFLAAWSIIYSSSIYQLIHTVSLYGILKKIYGCMAVNMITLSTLQLEWKVLSCCHHGNLKFHPHDKLSSTQWNCLSAAVH